MKSRTFLLAALTLGLAACGDSRQAELAAQIEAQQQQIAQQQAQLQAMQQQLQNGSAAAADDAVYQLAPEAVASTIPAAFIDGNQGQPVTGTDGQQYLYDAHSGNWLLYSLVGAAAGAFIGNSLAGKFQRAPAGNAAAQQIRARYHQSQPYRGQPVQTPNTLREAPKTNAAAGASPQYRQVNPTAAKPRPNVRRSGLRRR